MKITSWSFYSVLVLTLIMVKPSLAEVVVRQTTVEDVSVFNSPVILEGYNNDGTDAVAIWRSQDPGSVGVYSLLDLTILDEPDLGLTSEPDTTFVQTYNTYQDTYFELVENNDQTSFTLHRWNLSDWQHDVSFPIPGQVVLRIPDANDDDMNDYIVDPFASNPEGVSKVQILSGIDGSFIRNINFPEKGRILALIDPKQVGYSDLNDDNKPDIAGVRFQDGVFSYFVLTGADFQILSETEVTGGGATPFKDVNNDGIVDVLIPADPNGTSGPKVISPLDGSILTTLDFLDDPSTEEIEFSDTIGSYGTTRDLTANGEAEYVFVGSVGNSRKMVVVDIADGEIVVEQDFGTGSRRAYPRLSIGDIQNQDILFVTVGEINLGGISLEVHYGDPELVSQTDNPVVFPDRQQGEPPTWPKTVPVWIRKNFSDPPSLFNRLYVTDIAFSGPHPGSFDIELPYSFPQLIPTEPAIDSPIFPSLIPKSAASIDVVFSPVQTGLNEAMLEVSISLSEEDFTVSLQGNAGPFPDHLSEIYLETPEGTLAYDEVTSGIRLIHPVSKNVLTRRGSNTLLFHEGDAIGYTISEPVRFTDDEINMRDVAESGPFASKRAPGFPASITYHLLPLPDRSYRVLHSYFQSKLGPDTDYYVTKVDEDLTTGVLISSADFRIEDNLSAYPRGVFAPYATLQGDSASTFFFDESSSLFQIDDNSSTATLVYDQQTVESFLGPLEFPGAGPNVRQILATGDHFLIGLFYTEPFLREASSVEGPWEPVFPDEPEPLENPGFLYPDDDNKAFFIFDQSTATLYRYFYHEKALRSVAGFEDGTQLRIPVPSVTSIAPGFDHVSGEGVTFY